MTNKRKFTEQMLERVTPPRSGRIELGDTVVNGLLLRISEKGAKSFSVIYKVPGEGGLSARGRPLTGKQHRITLGRWPLKGLSDARKEAAEILVKASEGQDPRTERLSHIENRIENSFRSVAERYIQLYAEPNLVSCRKVESIFRLHASPVWGNRPIQDISRAEVHELLDKLVKSGKVGTAREVRKQIRSLFNWAVERGMMSANPANQLKRRDLAYPDDAGRVLEDFELRAIWSASHELGYPFGPLFQLLILTGQRVSDWANAQWSELDMDAQTLEIPGARFKNRRPHTVPLSPITIEIIKSLPRLSGEYIFSARGASGSKPVVGFSKPALRLEEIAKIKLKEQENDPEVELLHYQTKDFRKTCRTRLTQLGISVDVAERVIGHSQDKLIRTYNRHDYLEEKRGALAKYSDHILSVVS